MSNPREGQFVAGDKPASLKSRQLELFDRVELIRQVCTILVEAADPKLRARMLAILAVATKTDAEEPEVGHGEA